MLTGWMEIIDYRGSFSTISETLTARGALNLIGPVPHPMATIGGGITFSVAAIHMAVDQTITEEGAFSLQLGDIETLDPYSPISHIRAYDDRAVAENKGPIIRILCGDYG